MAIIYKYRVEGLQKVSADIAGKVCQNLTKTKDGLTPKRLVEVSRPETAPLHGEFEWNDDVAAEKFREEQARLIIKNVVIIDSSVNEERELKAVISEEVKDRAFVSTGERKNQYVTLATALSNKEWRESLLEQAKKDMIAFKTKYHRLTELSAVFEKMDDILGA